MDITDVREIAKVQIHLRDVKNEVLELSFH
jgi:hypothetical protein